MSPHGLILYKQMLDETGFIKKQQWTITNYVVLIYGAIIFLNEKFPEELTLALSRAAILTWVIATVLLLKIQYDLGRHRQRIAEVNKHYFVGDERQPFDIKDTDDEHPYTRGGTILVILIVVCLSGWGLVLAALGAT